MPSEGLPTLEELVRELKGEASPETPQVEPDFTDGWLTLPPTYTVQSTVMKGQTVQDESLPQNLTPRTYGCHGGKIMCVDANGVVRLGIDTAARRKALQQCGYSQVGMWVPFSNGSEPADALMHQEWRVLSQIGLAERRVEETRRHVAMCLSVARQRNVGSLDPTRWMHINGQHYRREDTQEVAVPTLLEQTNPHTDWVGRYFIQHGVIFAVSPTGEVMIAPHVQGFMQELESENYQPRDEDDDKFSGMLVHPSINQEQIQDLLNTPTVKSYLMNARGR